jgi:phasin family protein
MQSQFIDLYRASMKTAADLMKSSLEQSERLQQQQLELVRGALEENARSTSQLAEAKSIDEMLALNSRVAGAQLERVTEFWSSWWRMAGDAQKSMIDQMQTQLGQAKDRVREGYNFTARASEDAARIAASHASAAAGPLREAGATHERKERKSA